MSSEKKSLPRIRVRRDHPDLCFYPESRSRSRREHGYYSARVP